MKTMHFTSCDYTIIKTPSGQYLFHGTSKTDMIAHRERLIRKSEHIHRQVAALQSFLDGESVSNPDALRS